MAGKDKASALVTMVHGWEKTARKLARNAKIDLIKSNLYFTTSNVISFSSAISNQMKWFEFSKQKFHKIFPHIQHYYTGQRNRGPNYSFQAAWTGQWPFDMAQAVWKE